MILIMFLAQKPVEKYVFQIKVPKEIGETTEQKSMKSPSKSRISHVQVLNLQVPQI